ncbi:MAG TPA: formylmethanofuran dehydrogenase subunit E family protein [Candidatus Desulfovibrio intestinipullorum]|uniref:Formylmethanofuran dehydrogenase subunit E family protein n=1 Tax=Candidatus Desulfovibrio intestinipullorum TaxID=2838536 RepID=A0A9D1PUF1_9BACT|nr:formylmethanofuran dehydrogenase subunit E family protein [Candidatus Desulfovibrio intestinipullorum]
MIGSLSEEEFLQKVLAFHGHAAPGVLLGGFLVEAARAHMKEGCLFDIISETRQCLPDAVQILTPCTVGNGWLVVQDLSLYSLVMYDKHTGEGCRAWVDPAKLGNFPLTYEWFYKLKAKKEQDGEALRREILDHGFEMISTRPVQMKPEALGHKSKGAIVTCPTCGEAYPVKFGDTCPLCREGRSYRYC